MTSVLRYTCTGYINLIKIPYKSRFIANFSSCTTTELYKRFISCLTTIKTHVMKYCEKVNEMNFGILRIQIRFLINIFFKVFLHLVCLHMINLPTIQHCLYNLMKDKFTKLIE